jgi:hypothetical protein
MNWDAIGATGEILGALTVILTIVYLSIQVKHARTATVDQNRLTRATAIRELILTMCNNDELRDGNMRNWGLGDYYEKHASELGVSSTEASRNDWLNIYYMWTYWGQWVSSHEERDVDELKHVISAVLSSPGVRYTWENSPIAKPFLDEPFVDFVDGVIKEGSF